MFQYIYQNTFVDNTIVVHQNYSNSSNNIRCFILKEILNIRNTNITKQKISMRKTHIEHS